MKKIISLWSLAAIAIMLTPIVMYAQDSTLVNGAAGDILKTVTIGLATQFPVVGIVGTALFVVSEVLGSSKSIASNSVFQLVSSVLKRIFG